MVIIFPRGVSELSASLISLLIAVDPVLDSDSDADADSKSDSDSRSESDSRILSSIVGSFDD